MTSGPKTVNPRRRLSGALLGLALVLACATVDVLAGSGELELAQAQEQLPEGEEVQEGQAPAEPPIQPPLAPMPPGAAAQTIKKSVWGLTEHNGVSLFPTYQDLGVGLFQTQARWDQIALWERPKHPTDPDDPAYEWPFYLEHAISEAERHGMSVAIQLIGTPSWANDGYSWRWVPTRSSDFADFATALARKFPSVDLWMIWGEPNRRANFGPLTQARPEAKKLNSRQARAPRAYSQLLDSAYAAIKAVDRDDLVIGGNTYMTGGRETIRPYQWIRYMRLPDGSRPRMDMWGHNPFSYRIPKFKRPPSPRGRVEFSDLGRLAKVLDRTFFGPPLPLFLSEWGIPTAYDEDFDFHVSRKTSAKWTRAALRIVRRWPRIYTLGWSVPVDTKRNPQGLLDVGLRPKPAYHAFKAG